MEADLLEILKMHAGAAYIRITSPKIRLVDEFGIEAGYCRAEQILAVRVAARAPMGRGHFWGFMRPAARGTSLSLSDRGHGGLIWYPHHLDRLLFAGRSLLYDSR